MPALVLSLIAPAGCGFDTVVEGRNDPALDVPAVQAAVDRGGRILLRGRFNFGEAVGEPYELVPNPPSDWLLPSGPTHLPARGTLEASRNPSFWASPPQTVFVTKDVEIRGDGSTEIVGGYRTFTIGYRPTAGKRFVYDMNTDDGQLGPTVRTLDEYPVTPVRVTIADIHFVGSLVSSIWLAATRDETRIVGNRFTSLRPLIERYWFGSARANAVYTQGGVASIDFLRYLDADASDMQEVLPRSDGLDSRTGTLVQGDLVVRDNALETDEGGLIYAIALGGDVTVADNVATGGGVGIFGYFGHTLIEGNRFESSGPVLNTLRISEDSFGRHHPLTAAAGRTWAEGDLRRARTTITGNTVVSGGHDALSVLISENVTVADNVVIARESAGTWGNGIYLWKTRDSTVLGNTITGSAFHAVELEESSSNTLVDNDFRQFTPRPASSPLPPVHIAFLSESDDNRVTTSEALPDTIRYLQHSSFRNLVTGYGAVVERVLDAEQREALARARRMR